MPADTAHGLDRVVEGVSRRERFVLRMQVRLGESAKTLFKEGETRPRVIRLVVGRDAPEIVERAAPVLRLLDYPPLQQVRDV